MMQSSIDISRLLNDSSTEDPFVLAPKPNLGRLPGSASIDLALGTWFLKLRPSKHPLLKVLGPLDTKMAESSVADKHYAPLGKYFILHPRSFVLAVTLEWVRMPLNLCGYVTGKSSWGRRGLVIETAPGVHPGFTGCLTLEMANLGEIPIELVPGMPICQLFLHRLDTKLTERPLSSFSAQRQPRLGQINRGKFVERISPQQS